MLKTQKTSSPPEEALPTGRKGTLARATHSPVTTWAESIPETKQTLKIQTDSESHFPFNDLLQKVEYFTAGNIQNHLSQCKSITSDPFIIDIVKNGLKLRFSEEPAQNICHNIPVSKPQKQTISDEIQKLLQKEVINSCMREEGDFISSTFTREKRDGSCKTILNLKQLNKRIEYEHFKMESLQSILNIIRPNCWMASVDLKDAFYTFPIHPDHQKYLKFKWQEHYIHLGECRMDIVRL